MKLEIEQELVQALVNYLQTKPHKEVNGFIGALMQLKPSKPATQETEVANEIGDSEAKGKGITV